MKWWTYAVVLVLAVGMLAGVAGYSQYNRMLQEREEYNKQHILEFSSEFAAQKITRVRAIYNKLRLYTGMPTVPLVVLESSVLNAWADGSTITITTNMINFLDDDDEIATVLGHEMSHILLNHQLVLASQPTILSIVDAEAQADKMGAFLTMRAGFDICEGRKMWLKLAASEDGDYADPAQYNHPSYSYRYMAISMPWCPK